MERIEDEGVCFLKDWPEIYGADFYLVEPWLELDNAYEQVLPDLSEAVEPSEWRPA